VKGKSALLTVVSSTLTFGKPQFYPILTSACLKGRMYETNIVQSGAHSRGQEPAYDAEGLRPVSWGELVARLGAARDFRRVMGGRLLAGGASFNLASARHLAGRGDGKPDVNPIALANGKIAGGMGLPAAGDDIPDDRGRE
jgi:hypothetical protein